MRLGIAVFRFLPDGEWLKGCTMTNTKALAHIVPDKTYRGMWRAVRPDGSLSDMVNKTRAKDVASGLAENALYLGNAAWGRVLINRERESHHRRHPLGRPGALDRGEISQ